MQELGYALVMCGSGTQLAMLYRGSRGALLKRALDAKTRAWTQDAPRPTLACNIAWRFTGTPTKAEVAAAKRAYLGK